MEPDYSKPFPNPKGWIDAPDTRPDPSKPFPNPPGWDEQPDGLIAKRMSGRSPEHLRNGAAGARGENPLAGVPARYGGFGKPDPNRRRGWRGY